MKQRSFNKIFSAHFVRKDDNNHAGMMETFHNTKEKFKSGGPISYQINSLALVNYNILKEKKSIQTKELKNLK